MRYEYDDLCRLFDSFMESNPEAMQFAMELFPSIERGRTCIWTLSLPDGAKRLGVDIPGAGITYFDRIDRDGYSFIFINETFPQLLSEFGYANRLYILLTKKFRDEISRFYAKSNRRV